MRSLLVTIAILAVPPAFAEPPAPSSPPVREEGALVLDGVPAIPPELGERTRQYANTRGARLAAWDFDGPGMLVLTRFGETTQVHHVAGPGAARRQLTFLTEPVAGVALDPARPGGFWYLMDAGGGEFHQIFWYDLATGRSTRLTDGRSRNVGLSVPRAGGRLAWTSTARNGEDLDLWVTDGPSPDRARMLAQLDGSWDVGGWSPDGTKLLLVHGVSVTDSTIWIADAATGALTQLDAAVSGAVARGSPTWSGDGSAVFFTTDEGADLRRLVRYDLATGQKEVLTPEYGWDVEGVTVSRDGRRMAWSVNEGGRSALYAATTSRPEAARRVELPVGVLGGFGFDWDGERLGITLSTARTSSDVYVADARGRGLVRWTESEVGGLDPSRFVEPELVELRSFDGLTVPAWYYRPAGATGPVPVLVQIHGGPEGQSRPVFNSTAQFYVNELGVAVLQPNVRGSTGYGKTYVSLDNGFQRMDSVRDIGALLDWIGTRPELDADRVAVMGSSYGGFMVLASAVEYSDRLRCGVDMVGISHFTTFLQNTQAYRRDLRRVEYGDERDPEMRAFQERIAPLNNADRIGIPLLVGQGANDPRVPRSEAEQIVAEVREQGQEVWYVLARDEGHGFGRQSNREAWMDISTLFLERCLLQKDT